MSTSSVPSGRRRRASTPHVGPTHHREVPPDGSKWNEDDARYFLGIHFTERTSNYWDLLQKALPHVAAAPKLGAAVDHVSAALPPEYDFLLFDINELDDVYDRFNLKKRNTGGKKHEIEKKLVAQRLTSSSSSTTTKQEVQSSALPSTSLASQLEETATEHAEADDDDPHATPTNPPHPDVVHAPFVSPSVVRVFTKVLQFRQYLLRMMKAKKTVSFTMLLTYSSKINFVKGFENILEKSITGIQPDESHFVALFQDFTQMFYAKFEPFGTRREPGSSVNAKFCVRKIGGITVTSIPDLLYAQGYNPVSIVTVAEVKRISYSNNVEEENVLDKSEPAAKKPCHDENYVQDISFPSGLRGQHATQLLFFRPHTSMPNKNCILGMVVQGTKVRLTCLEMSEEHLEELGTAKNFKDCSSISEDKDIDDAEPSPRISHKSFVYYTKAFDMFIRKDRVCLVHILTTLAKHANDMPDLVNSDLPRVISEGGTTP